MVWFPVINEREGVPKPFRKSVDWLPGCPSLQFFTPSLPTWAPLCITSELTLGVLQISTCSDDNSIKIWRLKRGIAGETVPDKSNLVGWACQKKVEEQNGTSKLFSKADTFSVLCREFEDWELFFLKPQT